MPRRPEALGEEDALRLGLEAYLARRATLAEAAALANTSLTRFLAAARANGLLVSYKG